jgi:hypothetical protein
MKCPATKILKPTFTPSSTTQIKLRSTGIYAPSNRRFHFASRARLRHDNVRLCAEPSAMGAPAREGCKRHEMPCHHNPETYVHAFISGCGLAPDPIRPLFRTIGRGTDALTATPRPRPTSTSYISSVVQAGAADPVRATSGLPGAYLNEGRQFLHSQISASADRSSTLNSSES